MISGRLFLCALLGPAATCWAAAADRWAYTMQAPFPSVWFGANLTGSDGPNLRRNHVDKYSATYFGWQAVRTPHSPSTHTHVLFSLSPLSVSLWLAAHRGTARRAASMRRPGSPSRPPPSRPLTLPPTPSPISAPALGSSTSTTPSTSSSTTRHTAASA